MTFSQADKYPHEIAEFAQKAQRARYGDMNTSGLIPLTRRVLVLRDAPDEKKGSLIIPESVRDKEKHAMVDGTLIAVGPLAWAEDRHDAALYHVAAAIPEPGARVKVGRYT